MDFHVLKHSRTSQMTAMDSPVNGCTAWLALAARLIVCEITLTFCWIVFMCYSLRIRSHEWCIHGAKLGPWSYFCMSPWTSCTCVSSRNILRRACHPGKCACLRRAFFRLKQMYQEYQYINTHAWQEANNNHVVVNRHSINRAAMQSTHAMYACRRCWPEHACNVYMQE